MYCRADDQYQTFLQSDERVKKTGVSTDLLTEWKENV